MEAPKNIEKLIKHWIDTSDNDYETMCELFQSKKNSWSLFIGHIVIEKLLKAYFIKTNKLHPPFIHNLLRLAEKSNLKLSTKRKNILATLTTFNINARYDDYKQEFYKKCTDEYTSIWIDNVKELREWIKKQL